MASLTPIKPGDIVKADVKGRIGFVEVKGKERGKLLVEPITRGFTHRTLTASQVVTQYRKTKNTTEGLKPTGQDAD